MAILLPLVISPYALLHDLLLLFPIMILLARDHSADKGLLLISIFLYFAILILPLIGYIFKVALSGIIPIIVFTYIINLSVKFLRTPGKRTRIDVVV
jgi:hypothetical protein